MAHLHGVYDTDSRFVINPITRAIRNDSPKKTTIIQFDHNSERFTFELPRYVEGHDMSICNKVEVHYLNVDTDTKLKKSGVYIVDDLQISPDDNNLVICSWLIPGDATQLIGTLSFVVRYACIEGITTTYAWNTAVSSVNVSTGINASDTVVADYSDVLEKWKAELFNAGYINAATMQNEMSVLKSRMDTFASLPNGSTTGDAELQDIRVDHLGNSHSSAGSAVRAGLSVQRDIIESALNTVHLPVGYSEVSGLGFATNKDGTAILMKNENAVLRCGVINKTGYYNLFAPVLISKNELNETDYLPFVSYDVTNRENVFIEAGSHFYVFSSGLVPQHRVSYLPESIVISISPDEKEISITTGEEIGYSETSGLLEDEFLRVNTGRYGLYCFPVQRGVSYRLQSAYFDFPSAGYQLFGFVKATKYEKNLSYIKGGVYTNDGIIDIVLKSPIDGYLVVSNDTNTPGNFTLKKVTAMSKVSNIDRAEKQPYKKLLTIGDSLSGNMNLWQPTAIELLNIPEYGILGGAGLTISDQGADVNTIYNRVMSMEVDSDVDIITFWGGYNDFSSARVLSSFKEQFDKETRDSTTFYGGVLDCVEKILSTYPLKQIVMIGTTPFNVNGTWQVKTNKHGLKIIDYVNAFREVAEYYSIPFLDLLHTSGFNDYNYSTYYLDQTYWLHPNTKGHEIVGRKIAGFIKGLNGIY